MIKNKNFLLFKFRILFVWSFGSKWNYVVCVIGILMELILGGWWFGDEDFGFGMEIGFEI